jgi:iron(III) transport system substrate-binding protein
VNNSFRKIFLALSLLILSASAATFAQSKKESSVEAALALYGGENRMQRLIDEAKKEGELTWYESAPVEDVNAIIDAFTKKYGIKVKLWRSSSENVLQRIVNEARGGRFDVDIVENNAPEMEALHREKLLQQVNPPYLDDLIPQAISPHKEWIGTTVDIFVQAYNTDKVKKEELPKTYQDLLDPKWKGRLGIEAEDYGWFATLVQELGEEKGTKLFKDIVTTNGISVRKGHTLLTNLVASGEVPLGLTIYNYKPEQLKQKGAAIDWFLIPPAIAQFRCVGLAKKAPHPHAALLFYDFVLSDARPILFKKGFVTTSKKFEGPLNKLPLKFIDPVAALDMQDKWLKLFEEVITSKAK